MFIDDMIVDFRIKWEKSLYSILTIALHLKPKIESRCHNGQRRKRTSIQKERRQILNLPAKRPSRRQHVPIQRLWLHIRKSELQNWGLYETSRRKMERTRATRVASEEQRYNRRLHPSPPFFVNAKILMLPTLKLPQAHIACHVWSLFSTKWKMNSKRKKKCE